MINLENKYTQLRSFLDEELKVIFCAMPSYLERIAESTNIIFIHKEDCNKKLLQLQSPMQRLDMSCMRDKNNLNLTGSPLKDEFVVDIIADMSIILDANPWKPEEECHQGISVDRARKILSSADFQRGEGAADTFGSVWILCDGQDMDKTLLLQYEFNPGFNSRGVVSFCGVILTNAIHMQNLLRSHCKLIRAGNNVEICIENTYSIKDNISIKCSWTPTAALPSLIELTTCDMVLFQSFCFGDCNPSTQEFMDHLRILVTIRDEILAFRKHEPRNIACRSEPVYSSGGGIDLDDLRGEVNKVMTEISGFSELESIANCEYDIETVVQRSKIRCILDVTDKLWTILKCCGSFQDLKIAFHIVFQCAAKCNIVNTPTNKNRLAEIITEVANRRLAIPCLSGSEPLELLLEIGIEKLYRDYEFIFTESGICSANELKQKRTSLGGKDKEVPLNVRKTIRNATNLEATPARKTLLHRNPGDASKSNSDEDDLSTFKNSNFKNSETTEHLSRLLQIHCTLEHLLMIQIHLNLSSVCTNVCAKLLKKKPRLVKYIDDAMVDDIEINLSAHEMRDQLESKDPFSRRIILKSSNKFRHVESTFYYALENMFPPGISEGFQVEEKHLTKTNSYFHWQYHKIKTVCPKM